MLTIELNLDVAGEMLLRERRLIRLEGELVCSKCKNGPLVCSCYPLG